MLIETPSSIDNVGGGFFPLQELTARDTKGRCRTFAEEWSVAFLAVANERLGVCWRKRAEKEKTLRMTSAEATINVKLRLAR